jgi:uncharacterized protein (TIGR03083 family)
MASKGVQPVLVAHLFPEILEALLELLARLEPREWALPTACAGWTVHDVALHLLGDDVGFVSRKRDGHVLPIAVEGWEPLVRWIDQQNAQWVSATRRTSPRLVRQLLRSVGTQVCAHVTTLDPKVLGGPVSWAGPDPAPVWLDLAREYTERWLHQQHIRDAVGQPGLKEVRYLAPVLATFVRGVPRAYQGLEAPEGTAVALTIDGEAGGRWFVAREAGAWHLAGEAERAPQAAVVLEQETAWRLFSRGLRPQQARAAAILQGDVRLAERLLETVSILA